jgi:hypothetical protein
VERSGSDTGSQGRTLEKVFELGVVVFIETAQGYGLLPALQLPFPSMVLPTVMRF